MEKLKKNVALLIDKYWNVLSIANPYERHRICYDNLVNLDAYRLFFNILSLWREKFIFLALSNFCDAYIST